MNVFTSNLETFASFDEPTIIQCIQPHPESGLSKVKIHRSCRKYNINSVFVGVNKKYTNKDHNKEALQCKRTRKKSPAYKRHGRTINNVKFPLFDTFFCTFGHFSSSVLLFLLLHFLRKFGHFYFFL